MNIILKGVVGSRAYGLSHADSDTDYKGIYVIDTKERLKLFTPFNPVVNRCSPGNAHDDEEYYEIEKYLALASKCNPTILELMFLENYEHISDIGKELISMRSIFLNSKKIRNSYVGYANDQMKNLAFKGKEFVRYAKHARHCFRLLIQAKQLLSTGTLTLDVSEYKDFLMNLGSLEIEELKSIFEREVKIIDTMDTILKDITDYGVIDEFLIKVRMSNL